MTTEEDEFDDAFTACDRCGCDLGMDETYDGPKGTEWSGCTLCAVCASEVTPEKP